MNIRFFNNYKLREGQDISSLTFDQLQDLDGNEFLENNDFNIEDVLSLGDIENLSNVSFQNKVDNDFIVYNYTDNVWENKSPSDTILSLGITALASELNYNDLTLLGTAEASKVLTSDANGLTIFPDTFKLSVGTGEDLQIHHDGTNSLINNTTGQLRISAEAGSSSDILVGNSSSTVTIGQHLAVSGNLTVNGQTTTINSTVTTIDDPIMTLGGDTAPSNDDNKDRGIEFRWHDGTNAKLGFFGFDDSTSKFTFIPDSTNASEVFSGSAGNVAFGSGEFSDHLVLSNAKSLRLSELTSNGSNHISIKAPDSVTSDVTLVLPDGTGTNGQALVTDGNGNLSWSSVASGLNSSDITGQTAKTIINDNDLVLIADSEDSNNLKKMTKANFVDGLTANKTYSSKTSTFTAAVNYHYSVNTTAGAVTVNLPQISSTTAGESIVIKFRNGTNSLTLLPYSGDNLEGLNNLILTDSDAPGQSVTLVSSGSLSWEII
jgi:hypothetical protein